MPAVPAVPAEPETAETSDAYCPPEQTPTTTTPLPICPPAGPCCLTLEEKFSPVVLSNVDEIAKRLNCTCDQLQNCQKERGLNRGLLKEVEKLLLCIINVLKATGNCLLGAVADLLKVVVTEIFKTLNCILNGQVGNSQSSTDCKAGTQALNNLNTKTSRWKACFDTFARPVNSALDQACKVSKLLLQSY